MISTISMKLIATFNLWSVLFYPFRCSFFSQNTTFDQFWVGSCCSTNGFAILWDNLRHMHPAHTHTMHFTVNRAIEDNLGFFMAPISSCLHFLPSFFHHVFLTPLLPPPPRHLIQMLAANCWSACVQFTTWCFLCFCRHFATRLPGANSCTCISVDVWIIENVPSTRHLSSCSPFVCFLLLRRMLERESNQTALGDRWYILQRNQ